MHPILQRSNSTDKLTERIMVLGKEHTEYMKKLSYHKRLCEEQYKSRTRPNTPLVPANVAAGSSPTSADAADRRWLSSDSLTDWHLEDRWWLSKSCKSFLETREIPFGRKNVYLISKKSSPISNPDLRQANNRKSSKKEPDQVDSSLHGIATLSLAQCRSKIERLDKSITEKSLSDYTKQIRH